MKRYSAALSTSASTCLATCLDHIPAPRHSAATATTNNSSSVLIYTKYRELHRAMTSLGSPTDTQQPKPYFLSYAVADADSLSMSAQFGAITGSRQSHQRIADVQIRIGTPAEDNTHGDHRNSALTTIPLPLTDDAAALSRTLWFATNRGYAKALDGYTKVKTEQQVRAKEEDSSADFSAESHHTDILPSLSAAPYLARRSVRVGGTPA